MSEIKEFLLEEYRSLTEALRINEETGERRLTFFYSFSTAVLGAVVVFLTKEVPFSELTGDINNQARPEVSIIEVIILIFLIGLFVVGIIIQRRLRNRNRLTDGYIQDLERIRSIFKTENYDFKKLPPDYSAFKARKNTKPRKRNFTSLADIANVMNTLILAIIVTVSIFFKTGSIYKSVLCGILATIVWIGLLYGKAFWSLATQKKFTHAGGVLFQRSPAGTIEYLLVESSDKQRWVLPKGHIEKSETPEDAAIREVIEETGFAARSIKSLGSVNYSFNNRRIISEFFLMKIAPPENREQKWASVEEASKLLHPESVILLQKANKEILENNL